MSQFEPSAFAPMFPPRTSPLSGGYRGSPVDPQGRAPAPDGPAAHVGWNREPDPPAPATRPWRGSARIRMTAHSRHARDNDAKGALVTLTAPLAGLFSTLTADPAVRDLVSAAGASRLELAGPAAARPVVVAALAGDPDGGGAGRPVLAITATGREAEALAAAVGDLLG